jgi:hypothetical protein
MIQLHRRRVTRCQGRTRREPYSLASAFTIRLVSAKSASPLVDHALHLRIALEAAGVMVGAVAARNCCSWRRRVWSWQ